MSDALPAWLIPLIFGLMGACIGSFLNVVIYRTPLGISVNDPARSFCPECEEPIPWYLNIPVLSWLTLRGKSACCGTRISFRYCFVELLTALLSPPWGGSTRTPPREPPYCSACGLPWPSSSCSLTRSI